MNCEQWLGRGFVFYPVLYELSWAFYIFTSRWRFRSVVLCILTGDGNTSKVVYYHCHGPFLISGAISKVRVLPTA